MPGLLSIARRDVELVTLERPEKRNALSIDLRVEMTEAFERIAKQAKAGCGEELEGEDGDAA